MCSATLSMSMYSYGCVAAVGVAVCVSCCVFLYSTAITTPITTMTVIDTNSINSIIIMRMITTNIGTVSVCVVVVVVVAVVVIGVYSVEFTDKQFV